MKKATNHLLLCLSLILLSPKQSVAQDLTIHPYDCPIDTLSIVSAYLAKTEYTLPYRDNRGKRLILKQPYLFAGLGYGRNNFAFENAKPDASRLHQTRQLYYISAGIDFSRLIIQMNIGNSMVSANINYKFR